MQKLKHDEISVKINVVIPYSQYKLIKEVMKKEDKSLSEVVRMFINNNK
jgi:hypothetical protein